MELIQVVWDKNDAAALAREERALKEAESELNIPGKIIDLEAAIMTGYE
jgi:hypothetical protein